MMCRGGLELIVLGPWYHPNWKPAAPDTAQTPHSTSKEGTATGQFMHRRMRRLHTRHAFDDLPCGNGGLPARTTGNQYPQALIAFIPHRGLADSTHQPRGRHSTRQQALVSHPHQLAGHRASVYSSLATTAYLFYAKYKRKSPFCKDEKAMQHQGFPKTCHLCKLPKFHSTTF